jgi:hypothetical protein
MTLKLEKLDGENIVKDDKGRVLIMERGSNVAIARFPDMDEKTKKYIAEVYADLTGESAEKAMDFLNYKTDENEFCS